MRASAIVFGEESGIVRRICVSDSVDELLRAIGIGQGEAVLIVDPADIADDRLNDRFVPDLATCYALVEDRRGKPSESDRTVIIDQKSGEITAVIMADPVIDRLPGMVLFQHPQADVGWSVDAKGEWAKPVAEIAEPL